VYAIAPAMAPFRCPESEPHAWANALTMPTRELAANGVRA
jgi:hypothetical protein